MDQDRTWLCLKQEITGDFMTDLQANGTDIFVRSTNGT